MRLLSIFKKRIFFLNPVDKKRADKLNNYKILKYIYCPEKFNVMGKISVYKQFPEDNNDRYKIS